jgi:hypothetical protein
LVASLIAVPVIMALGLFEVHFTATLFAPFPEIHIMDKPMEYSIYVTFGLVCIVNIYSYFCVMLHSVPGLDLYTKAQVFTLIILVIFSFVLFVKLCYLTGFGFIKGDTMFDREWPNLMRSIHLQEFGQEGTSPCPGGKYRKDV